MTERCADAPVSAPSADWQSREGAAIPLSRAAGRVTAARGWAAVRSCHSVKWVFSVRSGPSDIEPFSS